MPQKKLDQIMITTRDEQGLVVEATIQRQNIVPYILEVLQQPHNNVETNNKIVMHFIMKILPDVWQELLHPNIKENMPRVENGVLWMTHSVFALFIWVFHPDHSRIVIRWYDISDMYEWQPKPPPTPPTPEIPPTE